ncbi:MAG: metal-sensitive transcriptional regulator [Candidatus Pacebacteria bacterium]|nr:metal-sensitive transcriptional regulator [Candidatus Paceibacterota bacterium]
MRILVVYSSHLRMTTHQDLITRLSRIEGQVAGLKRRLEENPSADCAQTLLQTKAATNALKRFAQSYALLHSQECIKGEMGRERLTRELNSIINTAFTLS